jgi:hypothetical protein
MVANVTIKIIYRTTESDAILIEEPDHRDVPEAEVPSPQHALRTRAATAVDVGRGAGLSTVDDWLTWLMAGPEWPAIRHRGPRSP